MMVGAMVVGSLTGCGNEEVSTGTGKVVETESATKVVTEEASTDEVVVEDVSEVVAEDQETESEEAIEEETEESKLDENGVYLGDYSGFTYSREYTAPTEADVEETIQDILDSNSTREYLEEGTVADGDTVVVSFTGTIDGEVIDGLSGEEEEFTIGEEVFLAEFEDALVGHDVGEEFEITLEFPEDYIEESIAGKTATITTVVNSIAGPVQEVELTDEWVKENSTYSTVDEYKQGIMEELEMQAEEYADSTAVYSLISDLYNVCYAEVSDEEVAEEFEAEVAIYKNEAKELGMTYEEYVKEVQSYVTYDTDEEYVEAFESSIKATVKEDIEKKKILNAFAEKESVDLSDEAYEQYLEREADIYGYESKDEFVAELESIGYDKYIRTIFEELQIGRKLMEISKLVEAEVAEPETTEETELVSEGATEVAEDITEVSTEVAEVETEEVTTEVVETTEAIEDTEIATDDVSLEVGEEVSLEE